MVAELYIMAESFSSTCRLTVREVEDKIKSLAEDFVLIRKYKEDNKIFIHNDIYGVEFVEDITVSDIINRTDAAKGIDRDVRNSLIKIIGESPSTQCTTEEIKVFLIEHNEERCCGLIGFDLVDGIDQEVQLVYGHSRWFKFRQCFLGKYPQTPAYFIDECIKYFPNLFFHQRNKDTVIPPFLRNYSSKITFHLAALNDNIELLQTDDIRIVKLKKLTTIAGLDEIASIAGSSDKKKDFTFRFLDDTGQFESVCCEPHLKLCRADDPLDNSYTNDWRIYFHEGRPKIQNGTKILIGHMGKHL